MTEIDAETRHRYRIIAGWLFLVAFMVFGMVVLGGVTRLTHSGLSMVDWRPITGWFPPLDEAAWRRAFDAYKQYPEYQKLNQGMTLGEFKGIFWFEFLHRLWGRIIGVAFFLPFVFFVARKWVSKPLMGHLALLFVLGGLQGGLGWFMVRSGLVDRPDVSQYRLAAHLCLALVIYAYLIWVALGLLGAGREARVGPGRAGANAVILLVFTTAFSGALVAGLDAGLTYNTFPLMDGDWIPEGWLDMQPVYLNFFENIATVQFDHRVLAVVTLATVLIYGGGLLRNGAVGSLRVAVATLAVMACIQVGLGIATLLMAVPVTLGALHQAGAVILLGFAVWVRHEIGLTQRT